MPNWFVSHREEVQGPFSTDDLRSRAANGAIDQDAMVWGQPMGQWQSLRAWLSGGIAAQSNQNHNDVQETTFTQAAPTPTQDDRNWHFAHQGTSKGPYKRDRLIQELKGMVNYDAVLLWTKGMKSWAPLSEFNDIADELNLNHRQFPRVQLNGKIVVRAGDLVLEGELKTLSEGGFGALKLTSLIPGEKYAVELSATELGDSIIASAELRYVSEIGYSGFRFENLSHQSKARVAEAIKMVDPNIKAA